MSKEITVITESAISNENYKSVEIYATSAAYQLSNTMENLLESTDENNQVAPENIDRAIDCADALVKVMAMFHKGREIESRREAFNRGVAIESSID